MTWRESTGFCEHVPVETWLELSGIVSSAIFISSYFVPKAEHITVAL